jgi:hypothetical protein
MAEQTERASHFEPLSALWRVLAAPQTLLILMGLVALSLAASTMIPQMPASFAGDPQAWLAMQAGVWAQAGDVLQLLGVFDIFGSLWFRAFLALAGLCLFIRMGDSLELAWRVTRREPWTRAGLLAWGPHPHRVQLSLPTTLEGVMERLGTFLARQGYATRTVSDLAVPAVVAVRRGLVLWTRPLAYGSLLFALVCLTVASAWGWQGEPWRPREGEHHAIGPDEAYSVRLDSFGAVSDGREQPSEYASTVTWLEGETVVRQGLVGAGQTSAYAGITLRQVGYVPVVRMRGWDGDDQPLMLETEGDVLSMTGEAEIRFDSAADAPLVLVPNEDLFLMLSFEQDCEDRGQALQVRRIGEGGDDGEVLGILHESGSVAVDGLRFELDVAFAPILRVDYHPAVGPALVGVGLFLVALVVGWLVPSRLLWIAAAEGQEHSSLVRFMALPGAGAQPWLAHLVKLFREALHDDA